MKVHRRMQVFLVSLTASGFMIFFLLQLEDNNHSMTTVGFTKRFMIAILNVRASLIFSIEQVRKEMVHLQSTTIS